MIREFRNEDAPVAVEVLRATAADWTASAPSLLHRLESHPPRARQVAWVAEEDGQLAGFARARLRWEVSERSVGWLWLGVRQSLRGRGLGGLLATTAERHLREAGAEVVESFAAGESGRRFLEERGYRAAGSERLSRLNVASADVSALPGLEQAVAAEGFRLVPLKEALARPRDVHAVYAATSADAPEDFAVDDIRYDEWVHECLEDPDLSLDGSAVVLHGERPVALSFLMTDGAGAAANDMTGTLPAFRRRGLARLAKLATIRWSAGEGVVWILTGNDDDNQGMLALNESLGYRLAVTQTLYVREEP